MEHVTSFIVEHDSPLTAWGQVQRDLRRRIDDGEFSAGQRMSTENDLIEYYDVSRITVRRAIGALAADGYIETRQGSGSFVRARADTVHCDLDLTRHWREQIVSAGHDAVSRLIETSPSLGLPPSIQRAFGAAIDDGRPTTFGLHVQAVDDVPVAITESWFSPPTVQVSSVEPDAVVHARGIVEVGYASAKQALLLRSFLDESLIVVTTRSSVVTTDQTVEIARTSWLGSRVRLVYGRDLTMAQIDMTDLIAASAE